MLTKQSRSTPAPRFSGRGWKPTSPDEFLAPAEAFVRRVAADLPDQLVEPLAEDAVGWIFDATDSAREARFADLCHPLLVQHAHWQSTHIQAHWGAYQKTYERVASQNRADRARMNALRRADLWSHPFPNAAAFIVVDQHALNEATLGSWLDELPMAELRALQRQCMPAAQQRGFRTRDALTEHLSEQAAANEVLCDAYEAWRAQKRQRIAKIRLQSQLPEQSLHLRWLLCQTIAHLDVWHTVTNAAYGPAAMATRLEREIASAGRAATMPVDVDDLCAQVQRLFASERRDANWTDSAQVQAAMRMAIAALREAQATARNTEAIKKEYALLAPTHLAITRPCILHEKRRIASPAAALVPPYGLLCTCSDAIWLPESADSYHWSSELRADFDLGFWARSSVRDPSHLFDLDIHSVWQHAMHVQIWEQSESRAQRLGLLQRSSVREQISA